MGETARASRSGIRPMNAGGDASPSDRDLKRRAGARLGGFDPRRSLAMLVMATRLGSVKARAALTFVIFLAVWLLLSIPDAFAASVTRASSFTYDSDGLLLTETVEPGDPQLGVETTYVYDAFGNKTSATTANLSGATGDAVIQSRTTTATFETNGRFATSTTNALGHTESAVTDTKFGVTKSQTGPNGLTTTWTYDSFGRVIEEERPDNNKTVYAYDYCSGVAGGTTSCPNYAAYVATATPQNASGAQNGPWVKTYYDRHGRVRQTRTQSFTGATILKDTIYDSYGRVSQENRPYLSGGTKYYTNYAYDALGRTVTITLPDLSVTSYGYSGLSTSVTNDLGQTETTVKNARGEIVSVTDANGKTTTFTYDPYGNRTSITDSMGNVQTMTYDRAGRKTAGNDPDLGQWSYAYNVLGELVSQTDAKSQTTTMTYDKLGRPLTRVEGGLTSTWAYDSGTKGIGKLSTASTSLGYLETLTYDSLGRPSSTAIRSETGASTYTTTTTYDADSRVSTIAYPSGFVAKYLYTATQGYLYQLKDANSSQLYWTANTVDSEGRVTQETAGNNVVTNRTFDGGRGFIETIQAGPSNAVANFSYTFDAIGNLKQRVDYTQNGGSGLTENFTYDVLNRLKTYNIVGGASKSVAYNDIGNITAKSDVGLYTYNASGASSVRPHAVIATSGGTLLSSTSYLYDANGAMTSGAGRTVTWTSFGKVATAAKGTTSLAWAYGPEHQRVKQASTTGATTTTTYYFNAQGVMFERVQGADVTWNDYLYAGGEMVGVRFDNVTTSTLTTRYFVKDHLGSVAVIMNEAGVVAERLAYDAWGKRRNPNGTDDLTNTLTASTTRGFTGHEMIDELDLVNMNGRVYDPTIGRFLSADPFIHDVTNSQDLNRYSYVHNNPLSYTDMNGYGFFKSIGKFFKKFWKTLLAIAVAVVLQQPWAIPSLLPSSLPAPLAFAITQGVSGGVSSVIATGKPKAFLTGFGEGFLFGSIGGNFAGKGFGATVGRFVAHGAIGCGFSEIRGRSCSSGFLSAGFTAAAAPFGPSGTWSGAAFRSVIGGTGSVLGGGKFADGAVTAAFAYVADKVIADRVGDPEDGIEGIDVLKSKRFRNLKVVDGVLTGEIVYQCWTNQECGYEIVKLQHYLDSFSEFDITLRKARRFERVELTIRLRATLSPRNIFGGRWDPRTGVLNLWSDSRSDTLFHEFGHALGVHHRVNSTGSIMSYSESRSSTFSSDEIDAILDAYDD